MATKIGSFFYEIYADSSKLQKSLSQSKDELQTNADQVTRLGGNYQNLQSTLDGLISTYKSATPENAAYAQSIGAIKTAFDEGRISAKDAAARLEALKTQMVPATSALDKFKTKFQQVTGISLTAASAFALVSAAIKKFADYVKNSVDATNTYVSSMTDMARMTGNNVEEMSRLTQAADDLFITQESLNTALTAAARQGIDTSIEGIKDLARQYNKLSTATEKSQFLAKNFGRNGMEMGKLLEVGADGIEKATQAISDNLIVTKESQRITYAYKRSVDALGDAVQGFAYKMGQDAMPALTDFNVILAYLTEQAGKANVNLFDLAVTAALPQWPLFRDMMGEIADKIRETNPEIETMASGIEDVGEKATLSAEQVAGAMMSIAGSISSIEEDYRTSLEQIAADEEMTAEERIAAIQKVEQEHEIATKKIILGYAEQILAADGLTQDEARALIQQGIDWGIYADNTLEIMDSVITEAGALSTAINAIPTAKTITITTVYATAQLGNATPSESTSYDAQEQDKIKLTAPGFQGGASGLDMVVPAGYPNDSYLIAASTGENVNIGRDDGASPELKEFMAMLNILPDRTARAIRDAMTQGAG